MDSWLSYRWQHRERHSDAEPFWCSEYLRISSLAQLTDPKINLKEVKNLLVIVLTVQRDSVPSTPFEITHTASSPWQIVHCDVVGLIIQRWCNYVIDCMAS